MSDIKFPEMRKNPWAHQWVWLCQKDKRLTLLEACDCHECDKCMLIPTDLIMMSDFAQGLATRVKESDC